MSGRPGRRGFTLVELLVVIGLMALMGTISIGGYFAASRGMKTRGAIQDTISFIRSAQQACLIDNVPTAVLFMNRYTGKKEDGGEMYGTAIAIKMAGRISNISADGLRADDGNNVGRQMLIDEFADWNKAFPKEPPRNDDSKQRGFRLYRMVDIKSKADGGFAKCSTLMCNWTAFVHLNNHKDEEADWLVEEGRNAKVWCEDANHLKRNDDNRPADAGKIKYGWGNTARWGLPVHPGNGGNKGMSIGEWRVGDAYGTEIGSFDLPKGFVFTGSEPDDSGSVKSAGAITFDPEKASGPDLTFDGGTVSIYGLGMGGKADALGKVGDIRPSDIKDKDN